MTPPLRVAVAGKGGAGKSLIAGTMARLLARRGHRVLVLDSDPMPGVAITLGLGPLGEPMLAEAVEKDADGRWRLKKGIGAARAVNRFAFTAPDGVRLLQSGKATADGLATIMGSISGFNYVAHRLAADGVLRAWSIVGDLPAGTRQAAYGWAPYAHRFLVIVEQTWPSALTARRVIRLARSRGDVDVWLVANKVDDRNALTVIEERVGEKVAACVPDDAAARDADRDGVALLDRSPDAAAVRAISALTERLIDSTR